jgi:hypothetical protein
MYTLQINEAQLQIISNCVNTTGAFTQLVPDKEKDAPHDFANWVRSLQHVSGLITMGFIEEITDKCSEILEKSFEETGRRFRIFEATKIAQQMFTVHLDSEGNAIFPSKIVN